MNYFGKFVTGFKYFYDEINPSNMTGAIDVVVIKHPAEDADGVTYISSPFHVKFGKYDILRPKERLVDITINGTPVNLQMMLGKAGEAYFYRPDVECDCSKCHHKLHHEMQKPKTTDDLENVFSSFSIFFTHLRISVNLTTLTLYFPILRFMATNPNLSNFAFYHLTFLQEKGH